MGHHILGNCDGVVQIYDCVPHSSGDKDGLPRVLDEFLNAQLLLAVFLSYLRQYLHEVVYGFVVVPSV
jgi:hypothetical protein